MKFRSVLKSIAYFWRAKKVWSKPKKAKILMYDRTGSNVLFEYIDQKNVEIMDIRGEYINLYVLLKCSLSLKISVEDYVAEYISIVKPSVAITFINNVRGFYKLKVSHPQLVTIFVQNGWNTEFGDIFGYFKKNPVNEGYEVDYMLTFGSAHGNKYQQYIKGESIPIGSFKNNVHEHRKNIESGTLVYISQFRPQPTNRNDAYISDGFKSIYYDHFYEVERQLLTFITNYCERKNLKLRVCGQQPRPGIRQDPSEQYDFFDSRINNSNWEFIPPVPGSLYGSYDVIDSAEYVVFIDSALGYESLARGKKTGAFTIRGETLSDSSRDFGWPAELADNGPFWTNHADEREFERVMDYLTSVSEENWENDRFRYVPDLIKYDSGNTQFLNLMRKLEVPLNPGYQTKVQ